MDNFVEDDVETDVSAPVGEMASDEDRKPSEEERKLVTRIIGDIKADKAHHKKAFDRMRRDMQVATWGAEKDWSEENYRAPIIGRHVKMKTAALYAKNPKVRATRRDTLDFEVWDENPDTLALAVQTTKQFADEVQAAMAQAQAMPQVDPMTGAPMPPQMPEPNPQVQQAQAILADVQQGMQKRQMIGKYGKTLEILFNYFTKEQMPVDFKSGMKQVVRRACTTCVGYVEIGFQREMGPRPGIAEQLADARQRLDHLRNLTEEVGEGEIGEGDAEMFELQQSIAALQAEPEIVLREGLIFDYPQSTKVIPDKMTKILNGFVGARRLTIEYTYTCDEVKELFGVDLEGKYTPYSSVSGSTRSIGVNDVQDDDYEWSPMEEKKRGGLVRVWKHYDKPSGLVYYVADGHDKFLREPAAPDVFVETFWPVYALTFNAVENEDEVFPPSDVTLLMDPQREYNRSRQGLREHRNAARPRWVYANGLVEEPDMLAIARMKAFQAVGINVDGQTEIGKLFQTFPTPGVDPNLYETGQLFQDIQLIGGAQEAQYGSTTQATATESAIAAGATNATDASGIDDLDSFLSALARGAGQVLQREMSEEKVREIAGPGAVWPQMTLADIAKEVSLEVEAGSTGKPNQAVEINNWKQIAPLLMQMPGVNPMWLAKETIRRLDDRVDVNEAVMAGIPSIAAQNSQKQVNSAEAGNDPNAQGGEGATNAPKPEGRQGSDPAFGSNQV